MTMRFSSLESCKSRSFTCLATRTITWAIILDVSVLTSSSDRLDLVPTIWLLIANVFCGDSLFNADVGSARCDFPGGDSHELYGSVHKLLDLPEDYKIWTGHDYPPGGEDRTEPRPYQTVAEQAKSNKHLKRGVPEEDFVKWRNERDAQLAEPKLLHWALQFNIRAGRLPMSSKLGDRLMHVPLKVTGEAW
jgi:hypothetical protein